MFNWFLIFSITMVSTTMLAFASAYISILNQAAFYYDTSRAFIVLLYNSFNILYLIITPFLFMSLKKYYSNFVYISVISTAVGCIGRYICGNHYYYSLLMSFVVAFGHIPIITAPYGLLDLFKQSQKGYAASIPLFLPTLGINLSILYGMVFIATSEFNNEVQEKFEYIEGLNLIIALLGLLSCIATIICMLKLRRQIKSINQESSQQYGEGRGIWKNVKAIKKQFTNIKQFFVLVVCWGTILGMNWTYGGMFQVFFSGTGLTNKQIAFVGLFANLSSVFFSNLGFWISKHTRLSNKNIICCLTITGFISSVLVFFSSISSIPFFHNKWFLILIIVVLRACFSSFVSLSLIELNNFGPSIFVSSLFFYLANATNLIGNYVVDLLPNNFSLFILSLTAFFSILLSQLVNKRLKKQTQEKQKKQEREKVMQSSQLANIYTKQSRQNEAKDLKMEEQTTTEGRSNK